MKPKTEEKVPFYILLIKYTQYWYLVNSTHLLSQVHSSEGLQGWKTNVYDSFDLHNDHWYDFQRCEAHK